VNQKSDDPLDREGLFFVVNWDTKTLGQRHDKLRGAVKEFNELLKPKKTGDEYHLAVVELVYPSHDNGLPAYAVLQRNIKL